MSRPVRLTYALACLAILVLAPPAAAGDDGAPEAVFAAVERHGVVVSVTFQRDVDAEERGVTPPNPKGVAERYRLWRMSQFLPGFVIRDRRTVLISDSWISPGAVRSITVRTASGFECEGTLHGFLVESEGAIIRTSEDLPLDPIAFSPEAGEARYAASIKEGPDAYELWAEDLDPMRSRPLGASGAGGFGTPEQPWGGLDGDGDGLRSVDLVTDGTGVPVGFRFGSRLSADERWKGERVLASDVVAFDALRAMESAAGASSPLHHLTVTFRVQSRHDRDAEPWYMRRSTAEQEHFGLAVAPDLLVVPAHLEDDQVRRIVSLKLDGDEEAATLTYLGRLRGYHAFLVRVEGPALACLPAESPPAPPTGSAFLVHRTAKRGGERRDEILYERVVGHGRGYGDRRLLTSERAVPAGAALETATGAVFGFAAHLDPEDRERRVGVDRRTSRSSTPYPVVAVLFHEHGTPADLGAEIDDRVLPAEETEARRLPWLGVEYDTIEKELAELLEISAPTRDGDRGLAVVAVHADSPAARAGLEPGDVLLSARRLSAPGGPPVDLKDGDRASGSYRGRFGGGAPAPWRSRDNALVRLLKDWGKGTAWELTWLRDGTERQTTLEVEIAPPDFSSAPRTFDEETGIEVRDLTYEVRHVLRLERDEAGVVVGRREPGSPAAQARIQPNELIVELDGAPVISAEAFGTMLEVAREEGRPIVRLVVRRLGRTRLVDLRVSSPGEEDS